MKENKGKKKEKKKRKKTKKKGEKKKRRKLLRDTPVGGCGRFENRVTAVMKSF
jgi:hypothetical protein